MNKATLSVRLVLLLSGALTLSWAATVAAQDDETNETEAPAEAIDETEADEAQADDDAAADDATDEDATDGEADDAAADDAAADDAATDPAAGATAGDTAADGAEADDAAGATEALEAPEPEPTEEVTELSAPDESALDEGDLEAEEADAEAADGEEAEEEAPSAEPLPWRNTFLSWNHGATFNTFVRDAQLSYNPTYVQSFSLSPRWYVLPTSFFWANLSLQVEVTDDDGNALNRDPQIGDAALEFRHLMPWEGFVFIGQMRLTFPTSKISQAAQRYVQTGLGLTVVRPVSEANLTIAGIVAYRRWWAGSNVAQSGAPQPDNCAPILPSQPGGVSAPEINTTTCDQFGSATGARDIFLGGISATWVPFAGFNVNLSAFLFTTYGFELADAVLTSDQVITQPEDEPLVIPDGSPSHWNNFTFISLSVGYQFLPWLNVALGIQNSGIVAPVYNPDGSFRNPIFTPDTQVFLTGTFQLDAIWQELVGGGEDDLTPEERQRRRQGLASGPSAGGSF